MNWLVQLFLPVSSHRLAHAPRRIDQSIPEKSQSKPGEMKVLQGTVSASHGVDGKTPLCISWYTVL